MIDNIDFVIQAENELTKQTFTPSLNKIIKSVLDYDPNIKSVAIIVDGRTMRQNNFNQNIIDVLDIIDNNAKISITENVNKILAEKKQKLREMIITEAMKNGLKNDKAVIFVDAKVKSIKKNGGVIINCKWRIVNKN